MVTHDMRRILFTLTLAAMSAMMAIAQVTFKIEAPRQTEVGQQIRVKYVANTTDVEDIHVGDFPGFEVVYGPSTSRSTSFSGVLNSRQMATSKNSSTSPNDIFSMTDMRSLPSWTMPRRRAPVPSVPARRPDAAGWPAFRRAP